MSEEIATVTTENDETLAELNNLTNIRRSPRNRVLPAKLNFYFSGSFSDDEL